MRVCQDEVKRCYGISRRYYYLYLKEMEFKFNDRNRDLRCITRRFSNIVNRVIDKLLIFYKKIKLLLILLVYYILKARTESEESARCLD
jgi:hypothetical protein